ncbi:MAG TPA: hypothetical protein VLC46_23240 [Thermoanaerobaculia bacterium]|jgi:hypothetical protein|nr:hypothetical protein [Thermoanaerobaculia bacterium]
MRFVKLALLLLLAMIFIVEPVVHTHPFAGNGSESDGIASSNVCAICAVAAHQITVARVTIAAPATVADLVIAVAPLQQSLSGTRPLASRAPPAA